MSSALPLSSLPDSPASVVPQAPPVSPQEGGRSAADVLARRRIGGVGVSLMQEPVQIVDDRHKQQLQAQQIQQAQKAAEKEVAPVALESKPLAQHEEPRRFRWARNVLLGASLSFADAGLIALRPVGFVWKNVHVIALAATYLLLPLALSLFMLDTFPRLAEFCKTATVMGLIYFSGLYVSSAVLLMLGAFSGGFLFRGSVRLMDHFARRGEEAFPKD